MLMIHCSRPVGIDLAEKLGKAINKSKEGKQMKKRILITFGITFILTVAFLLANRGITNAADCRIVRIYGMAYHESVRIEPTDIRVEKGTCVIWFNKTPGERINITFEDGKKCEDVTDPSVDFKLDEKSCFITTTHIRPGGTASLRFNEKGTFDYTLEAQTQDKKVKGRIYVR